MASKAAKAIKSAEQDSFEENNQTEQDLKLDESVAKELGYYNRQPAQEYAAYYEKQPTKLDLPSHNAVRVHSIDLD